MDETPKLRRLPLHRPTCLVLSRQALPTLDRSRYAAAAGVARGAYVLADAKPGKPEVILELHYGNSLKPAAMDAERLVWNGLPSLPAVKNKRVYLLAGDEFVVPGPRIVVAAERFARTLHPEAFN